MRIISGTHKGRKINAPKDLPARPTTDMAKEGLFNILNNRYYFEDLQVLDLFAGTGNISYEFASRGAPSITAVDQDRRCVQFIERMSRELDFPIRVWKGSAEKFLDQNKSAFDIVFADPPYKWDLAALEKLHMRVFETASISDSGLLIIEHPKQTDLSEFAHFTERRKYGSSSFSFFSKAGQ